MRVVFVTPRPFGLAFGGLEIQLLSTRLHLENMGVAVYLLDYFNRDLFKNIDLVHFFGLHEGYFEIAELLKAYKIPYLVSPVQYGSSSLSILVNRLLANLPTTTRRLLRKFLHSASALLPNSEAEVRYLRTAWGLPHNKLFVVPNGVERSFIGSPETFYRGYLNNFLEEYSPFILSVGRIDRRKNTLNLVKACLNIGVPLVLIGQPYFGDLYYAERVLNVISHNKRQIFHIPFLPPLSRELASAYAAAKVHALVSLFETPGLATLEAGLNGANLVVGKCPPVEEYLSDMSFMANPRDVIDIEKKVWAAFKAPRDAFGQSNEICKKYTWEIVAEKTYQIYKEIVSETS